MLTKQELGVWENAEARRNQRHDRLAARNQPSFGGFGNGQTNWQMPQPNGGGAIT